MKARHIIVAIATASVLGLGCGAVPSALGAAPQSDTPTQVTEKNEAEFASRALGGDPGAAWDLAVYFGDKDGTENAERSRNWRRIAIENRSPEAMLSIGYSLASSHDPCSQIRGVFLMREGLKLGAGRSSKENWARELRAAESNAELATRADCRYSKLLW